MHEKMNNSELKISSGRKKNDFKTIKSFQDACLKLNLDPKIIVKLSIITGKQSKSIIAGFKLSIISEALRDGWQPDWENVSQKKYYPGFQIISPCWTLGWMSIHTDVATSSLPSRFYVDTREKAEFFGTKFKGLWKDYLVG